MTDMNRQENKIPCQIASARANSKNSKAFNRSAAPARRALVEAMVIFKSAIRRVVSASIPRNANSVNGNRRHPYLGTCCCASSLKLRNTGIQQTFTK